MTAGLNERSIGYAPPPPNDGDRRGGGGDDGDGWQGGNPEETPSLKQFMQMSREMQAGVYRTAVRYRCRMQKRNFRSTAEYMHRVSIRAGMKSTVEGEMEMLRHAQANNIVEADAWFDDPSQLSVPAALLWLYPDEENVWNLAEMLGLFDDQPLPKDKDLGEIDE